ncbi:4'-phosphopantetheinyl transferase [Plantactinospora sp. GCM10030261]|uniref:4'-phosphopantetheinyl transferase family protein n=1 Tax=Plantactinospora sp. GCM10030261 TaxID=3273420 RepID=UPI0036140E61
MLPATVAWAEAFDDSAPCPLFPAEEAVIARAVEKRRREFTTGRWCARQALAQLGHAPVPIVPGTRGAPTWPLGLVGTITHCTGYRAAVVGRSATVLTVGVDAEPDDPLPPGVLDAIGLPEERDWIAERSRAEPKISWGKLLFSAKESVYKAWYPLTGRWLGFEEARITIDATGDMAGTFTADLLVDGPVLPQHGPLRGFAGRWLAQRGLVVTAIVVPADADRPGSSEPHAGAPA